MNNVDICCIGHITSDKVITGNGTRLLPGGTAYYFASALNVLNASYEIVTKMNATDFAEIKNELDHSKIRFKESNKTTFFENIYGEDQDDRTQNVLARADPFKTDDLSSMSASWYHLGPLLQNDIPFNLIEMLCNKGRISIDAQGFLRKLHGQKVSPCDWVGKQKALPLISILKVNKEEAAILTGQKSVPDACKYLADAGVKEVVLTKGSKGSLIRSEEGEHKIPAYPPAKTIDTTGCGDTYMAGYLFKRANGLSIEEAGNFGAQLASKKIEGFGALKAL